MTLYESDKKGKVEYIQKKKPPPGSSQALDFFFFFLFFPLLYQDYLDIDIKLLFIDLNSPDKRVVFFSFFSSILA